jgi:uncharacterized protein YecE (DUF72 family)
VTISQGKAGTIRIGISGWTYAPWRGVFYPQGLRQKDELSFASRQVGSIEINGTFYRQQAPKSFAAWAAAAPEDFMFSIKGPRFITHIRRLREIEGPLANFMASGLLNLGPKLGPILWQFPPNFTLDLERFAHFLDCLPKDTASAAALAARHDGWLKDRSSRRCRRESGRCAMRWKSGMRVSATRPSSICCGRMGWRWSARIRWNGRG